MHSKPWLISRQENSKLSQPKRLLLLCASLCKNQTHETVGLTPKFKRAFRNFAKRNTDLQQRIETTFQKMEADVFPPILGTYKLGGKLVGLQSCSCGYRVIFSIEQDTATNGEVIVLIDIGTHDEVY